MKTEFQRKLHELLIQDNISWESGIVNDLTYRMVQVEVAPREYDNSRPGFDLSSYRRDSGSQIEFNLPAFSLTELRKVLALFGMDEADYKINSPLVFKDESVLLNNFIPAFTSFYNALKASNSPIITQYQNKSKPILEANAISTLRKYTQDAIDLLIKEKLPSNRALLYALITVKGCLDQLNIHPQIYTTIIKSHHHELFTKVTKNEELNTALKMVNEGVALFTKYNRTESVLAIQKFQNEVEDLLNQKYRISSKDCDVIEGTLLAAAAASLGKQGKCSMRVGNDTSRMVFRFEDMDATNAAKVVDYLQQLGDKTATEGYGRRAYGSHVPEAAMNKSMPDSDYSSTEPEVELEEHSIEVDGSFLYQKLFPELKAGFARLEEARVQELQKRSKRCWDITPLPTAATSSAASVNRNVWFQPADGVVADSAANPAVELN
ncbi:MAG: hypothetical protein EPN84_08220 [Legionella sp.]|nr:MAG: hypothetical protein EPN84_08220 [Legionella sp.]